MWTATGAAVLALSLCFTPLAAAHGTGPRGAPASASALSVRAASGSAADAPGRVSPGVVGGDISWPNCPKGMGVEGRRTLGLPMPAARAQFVVIGLTNGRAFTANPCLSSHVAMAKTRKLRTSAYTMLSYPNKAERAKYGSAGPYATEDYESRLSNVGYAQSAFALDAMARAGMASPMVWIDVEPRAERPWSKDVTRNRALIRGALRAAADRGIGSGIYTYAIAWRQITGNDRVAVPLWAPGHSHAKKYASRLAETRRSCVRTSFTGGPLVMTQMVWRNRDVNITCTAIAGVAAPLWLDYGQGP